MKSVTYRVRSSATSLALSTVAALSPTTQPSPVRYLSTVLNALSMNAAPLFVNAPGTSYVSMTYGAEPATLRLNWMPGFALLASDSMNW
jgi:hypothetical protein